MRIPGQPPMSLDPLQAELYARILGGDRASQATIVPVVDSEGVLQGPFNAFLLNPVLGAALSDLGRGLRYEGELSARAREISILAVAAHHRSAYEWHAHARLGAAAGLSEPEIAALASGEHGDFEAPDERMALAVALALVEGRDVDDELFAEAKAVIGADSIFEVSVLVGYYRMLAEQLALFRVDAPPGPWDA